MNERGIAAFKQQISVGDELSVGTREFLYYGTVTSIEENSFEIDESGHRYDIFYSHVYAYSKQ